MLQQSLQSIHFRYFTGKVFFLKGLWTKCESPAFLPGFFSHCIQDSGLGETTRHADVVDSSMDVLFRGLTVFLVLAGPERVVLGWYSPGFEPLGLAVYRSLCLCTSLISHPT